MSFVPGWFTGWAEAQSLNPNRPDLWPDAAKAAFLAEKLRRFRLHWRWLSKIGQLAIIRAQSGRAELIRQVRRELDDALAPCPVSLGRHAHTSPFKVQPRQTPEEREAEILAAYDVRTYPDGSREIVLPPRPSLAARKLAKLDPWMQLPIEEVAAWVEAKPERAEISVLTARCLCWLEQKFSRGSGRVTAAEERPGSNAARAPGSGAISSASMAGAATPRGGQHAAL